MNVYDAYWSAWDTTALEIYPYRNEELECHSGHTKCGYMYSHNFRGPDSEYLDEKKLTSKDILDGEPHTVELGEDHIDSEELNSKHILSYRFNG